MPSLSTYALFLGAGIGLLAIPGPAVLYVVGRSIDQGRRAGLVSVLGISTGTLVHITAATVGLSSLVLASTVAFNAVKYVGAAYLVFLGVRRLLTRAGDEALHGTAPRSLRRLYADGIVVNVLNPKSIVFIFAFLPQFVDVSRGHVWLQATAGAAAGASGQTVVLAVTDDGPGFPPGAAEHVFERFYRADPARTGPGSGLGLAIVRELATAHGGAARAENVAPHGARVSVTLPRLPLTL